MPDTSLAPRPLEPIWRRSSVPFNYGDPTPAHEPPPPGHHGLRTGMFGERVVCQTCATIATADHRLKAWLSADLTHAYPFGKDPRLVPGMDEAVYVAIVDPNAATETPQDAPGSSDETEVAPTPGRFGQRAAMGLADYPDRSRMHGADRASMPSRSRYARRMEKRRERARKKLAAAQAAAVTAET